MRLIYSTRMETRFVGFGWAKQFSNRIIIATVERWYINNCLDNDRNKFFIVFLIHRKPTAEFVSWPTKYSLVMDILIFWIKSGIIKDIQFKMIIIYECRWFKEDRLSFDDWDIVRCHLPSNMCSDSRTSIFIK